MQRSTNREENRVPGWLEHKARLYLKNNQHKKDWRHGCKVECQLSNLEKK
jgi:hypothetical protein